jgi:CubicO group peptidase (beta-lactamase class C family)
LRQQQKANAMAEREPPGERRLSDDHALCAARTSARERASWPFALASAVIVTLVWLGVSNSVLVTRILGSYAGVSQTELYRPSAVLRGIDRPAPLPLAPTDERRIAADALAAASAYAQARGSTALLVWYDGALQHAQYWNGTRDTKTDSLSMHKTLAALAIGVALDQGAIASLDEPIGRLIREWQDDPRGAMTLRQVLTMASGIRAERMQRMPPNGFYRMMMGTDVTGGTLAVDLADTPGERFVYVNTNTQILAIALERATGRPYADFVAERLWQPLGNADALLWLDRPGGTPRVFCCLLSNAENWLRLGRMIAENGRVGDRQVISPSFLRAMLAPSAANANYGFQIWRATRDPARFNGTGAGSIAAPGEAHVAEDLVYLAGFGAQRTYIVPRCGLVIVRTGAQVFDWDDAVLPNTILRGLDDRSCWAAPIAEPAS